MDFRSGLQILSGFHGGLEIWSTIWIPRWTLDLVFRSGLDPTVDFRSGLDPTVDFRSGLDPTGYCCTGFRHLIWMFVCRGFEWFEGFKFFEVFEVL